MNGKGLLLIRTDANKQIGTGHVMRCLALGQTWLDAGGQVLFASIESVPLLNSRLQREGMQLAQLTAVSIGSKADAQETAVLAKKENARWVVVDGYQFDAEYQKQLVDSGCKTLFLDDYGHAEHYHSDFVLNQNIYASPDFYKKPRYKCATSIRNIIYFASPRIFRLA